MQAIPVLASSVDRWGIGQGNALTQPEFPPGVHTILHSLIVFSAIIRQEVYLHVMIRDATLEIFAMTTLLESIEGLLLQGRFGIILRHPHLAVAVTLTITGEDRHQCLTGNVIRLRRLSSEDATHQTPRTVVMVDRLLCRLPLHPMIDMSEGRMTGMPPILFSTREGPELPLQGCETNMIESHLQPEIMNIVVGLRPLRRPAILQIIHPAAAVWSLLSLLYAIDVDQKVLIVLMTKLILVTAGMATATLGTLLVVLRPLAHLLVEGHLETIFLRAVPENQRNPAVFIEDTEAKGSRYN